MNKFIPVYEPKIDPITGQRVIGLDGLEVLELVRTIEIIEDPVFEPYIPSPEELAQIEADKLAQEEAAKSVLSSQQEQNP